MKHISHRPGSGGYLASGLACLIALSLGLSQPTGAQEPQDGSLNDMWQDHQTDLKPSDPAAAATTAETEESKGKKSKKEKKKKEKKEKPKWDADLTKPPPDSSAPGWNEGGSEAKTPPSSSTSGTDAGSTKAGSSDSASQESKSGGTGDLVTGADSSSTGSTTSSSKTSSTTTGSSSTPPRNLYSPTIKGLDTKTGSTAGSSTSSSTPSSTISSDVDAATNSTSTGTTSNAAAEPNPSTPASSASWSSPTTSAPTSTGTSSSSASSFPDSTAASDGTNVPLCKLSSLATSDFVKSGGWPGVGPFSKDNGKDTDLVDESKNRLKLQLSGEDVTHAELLVVNQSTKPSQLLALQMTADFLLEACGAPSGRIADLNNSLEQNHGKLIATANDTAPGDPVSIKAGTYLVSIQRRPPGEQTVPGNTSYLIAVDNQKPQAVVASSDIGSTVKPAESTFNSNFTVKTLTTGSQTTTPKTTTPAVKPPDDALRTQFTNLIQGWQQVKRNAVKSRQTANLTRILGGTALSVQNKAITWLLEKRLYYEMTPLEMKVRSYTAVVPNVKYEVDTFIKERQQLMSADTMKPVKELVEKSSNVIYTVEKIRGVWLITNTRMPQ